MNEEEKKEIFKKRNGVRTLLNDRTFDTCNADDAHKVLDAVADMLKALKGKKGV